MTPVDIIARDLCLDHEHGIREWTGFACGDCTASAEALMRRVHDAGWRIVKTDRPAAMGDDKCDRIVEEWTPGQAPRPALTGDLTAKQHEVLTAITTLTERYGYPPTVRELGEAVGLSSASTVHAHLTSLERKGFIRRDPTKPRALVVEVPS